MKFRSISFIPLIVVILGKLSLCTPILFQLAARNLSSSDIWGDPDPYIKVKYAIGKNPFVLVGRTKTLHTSDPDFPETWKFQYVDFLNQSLQFVIKEDDVLIDDDYGTIVIKMKELLNVDMSKKLIDKEFAKGHMLIRVLENEPQDKIESVNNNLDYQKIETSDSNEKH